MRWKDIYQGASVYHAFQLHLGPGIVKDVITIKEKPLQKPIRRILVEFQQSDKIVEANINELRISPNKRRIKDMVALYQSRGQPVIDHGDWFEVKNYEVQEEVHSTD